MATLLSLPQLSPPRLRGAFLAPHPMCFIIFCRGESLKSTHQSAFTPLVLLVQTLSTPTREHDASHWSMQQPPVTENQPQFFPHLHHHLCGFSGL